MDSDSGTGTRSSAGRTAWESGTTFADAASFSLEPGAVVPGDQLLAGAGALTGTVVDDAGRPVVAVAVRVYDSTARVALAKAVTDGDGRYRIGALAPGLVTVRFGDQSLVPLEWYDDQTSRDAADRLTIDAGATTTADAVVAPWPS